MKIFSERLRESREQRGLSCRQLAKLAGLNDASVSNWENNVYDIKGESLVKLCECLGVSADWLLGLKN